MPVTDKLKAYYTFYQDLKQNGGPEENVDLFEEVVELEEEIMAAYGLPPSHHHLQILWQLTSAPALSEDVVEETKLQLQQAATNHLMAPVRTNLEVLQEAQSDKQSAFNVLPEIGQPTHDYPLFLYEELLLKGKATPEAVLREMEKVKELDCYGDVATLLFRHKKSFRKTNIYKNLKPHLQFLDTYLLQVKELGESANSSFIAGLSNEEGPDEPEFLLPEDRIASELDASSLDPQSYNPESILLTGPLEIEEIVYAEDTAITVNGLLHAGTSTKQISLGFDKPDLLHLLSKYEERGNHLHSLISLDTTPHLPDEPIVLHLKDTTGSTILVDQHYFMAYKPLVLDEEGNHKVMEDDFYLVEEVVEKTSFDAKQVKSSKEHLKGMLTYVSALYQTYLEYLLEGISEKKARKQCGLISPTLFELARHIYTLEKHGGSADLK